MTILLLVTLYLGWRLVQAVAWVIEQDLGAVDGCNMG